MILMGKSAALVDSGWHEQALNVIEQVSFRQKTVTSEDLCWRSAMTPGFVPSSMSPALCDGSVSKQFVQQNEWRRRHIRRSFK